MEQVQATTQAIGYVIRNLRQNKNLTTKVLANKAKVARTLITQIELGQVSPSLRTLGKIANALDCQASLILKLAEKENIKTTNKKREQPGKYRI